MRTWLTEHRFAFLEVFARLRRQPLSAVLNILVVGVAMALPLFGYTVLSDLQPITGRLASDPEISVFMTLDATRSDAQALGNAVREFPGVAELRFVPRESALADLKQRPGMDAILSALSQNPLPDAWIVRIAPPTASTPQDVIALQNSIADRIRRLGKVEHVHMDSQWVERVEALLDFLRLGLALLATALAAAVIAVIFNTVRLQVLTQRDEIEVSSLFGATNRFIRRPFYYVGALEGVAGGLLALALVYFSLVPLNDALLNFARLYGSQFQLAPPTLNEAAGFLGIAAILGWFASVLSVGRHLTQARS
ncbi:MAG: permease-like cell division protein FtsX [Burkholderiaceae bacterium]|jgi:cell division transport system permease protein